MNEQNQLVLIGNGFDLAHGLKTSYKDFLDWYMCESFKSFLKEGVYSDPLIEIRNRFTGQRSSFPQAPKSINEVINFLGSNDVQQLRYVSDFFNKMLDVLKANNWVDLECFYFQKLKNYFLNQHINDKQQHVRSLNQEFNVLIGHLTDYIKTVDDTIDNVPSLKGKHEDNFSKLLSTTGNRPTTKFLTFNYTDTLSKKYSIPSEDVIHIHGRVSELESNPIIFGYGDETDPTYQAIEDAGENIYLEHIKSFGYFATNEYHRLLSFVDSAPYKVYVLGHSCGLSDRVLLNEIFEHPNCTQIEILYHKRQDGSDNFKEITQEASRHFKPNNKNSMRRKIMHKDSSNIIPQSPALG